MTIIGIERQKTGHVNVLVFDPMFHDAAPISKLVDKNFKEKNPDKLLKPYRRGNHYLKKFREFELLRYVLALCSRVTVLAVFPSQRGSNLSSTG